MVAGFPFCSLQATTQHLHPMHFPMSKWKRYCSPGSSARVGMRSASGTGPLTRRGTGGADGERLVSAYVTPSSATRVSSGSGIEAPWQNAIAWCRRAALESLDWELDFSRRGAP